MDLHFWKAALFSFPPRKDVMWVTAPCTLCIISYTSARFRKQVGGRRWNLALPHANSGNKCICFFGKKCLPSPWRLCSKEPLCKSWELFLVRDPRTACSAVCGWEVGAAQHAAEAPLPGDLKRLRDLLEPCLSPHRAAGIRLRMVPSEKLLWPAPPALGRLRQR